MVHIYLFTPKATQMKVKRPYLEHLESIFHTISGRLWVFFCILLVSFFLYRPLAAKPPTKIPQSFQRTDLLFRIALNFNRMISLFFFRLSSQVGGFSRNIFLAYLGYTNGIPEWFLAIFYATWPRKKGFFHHHAGGSRIRSCFLRGSGELTLDELVEGARKERSVFLVCW